MKTTLTAANTETRGILAAAYKGRRELNEAARLTHLVRLETETAVCNKRLNVVDTYGHCAAELVARPTCPVCATKWDKINAPRLAAFRAAAHAKLA